MSARRPVALAGSGAVSEGTVGHGTPRSRWTLPIAAGAGFLAGLDTTAINLALPDVQRDLGAGLAELQWVVNAFALLSATVLVVAGTLSDRHGARRVFVGGLLGFAATSALCGLAWSPLVLDVARGAQGAAAAVLTAGGLALLAATYPSAERGRALGLYGTVAALSFVVGPLLGGLVTDALGWRAVFMVNVPIALLFAAGAGLLAGAGGARGTSPGSKALDPLGVVTFVLGIGGVQYAAMAADADGWTAPPVLAAAAVGAVALGCFVALERRTDTGLVDLRLFRLRTFSRAAVAMALASAAYFGLLVYLSLFLQSAQDYSALETGLIYLPTILPYMAISPLSGRLVDRYPGPVVPAAGCAVISLGMVLLTVVGGTGLLDLAPAMAVTGIGTGLVVTPLTKLALDQVPDHRTGMAGGIMQTMRPLGVTLGVTVLGLAVPGTIDVDAFEAVALIAAALAASATVVAGTTITRDGPRALATTGS